MANISVTELMEDADFVDDIQVITRFPTVNYLGENVIREEILETFGSVQPLNEREVQKIPEAMRVADMSTFYFKGIIVAVAPGEYASVLVFNGKRYQVKSVSDWSNWGRGYTQGICVSEVPAP